MYFISNLKAQIEVLIVFTQVYIYIYECYVGTAQHKKILIYGSIICVLKFDYDYDIPFHNLNYENLANWNGHIIAKD